MNSDKLSANYFFVIWNVENTWCILQNELNEGHETKAAFQGSFKLRWPSAALDDMAVEICSLPFEKQPEIHIFWIKTNEQNRNYTKLSLSEKK